MRFLFCIRLGPPYLSLLAPILLASGQHNQHNVEGKNNGPSLAHVCLCV